MDFKVLLAQFMEDPSTGSTVTPPTPPSNGRNGKARKKLPNIPASELPTITEPQDFRSSMHWRIFRIMAEMMNGWQFLADFKNNVAIFGSANITENEPLYQEAIKLGTLLADAGFNVVTGGGPGILEAANRGAAAATSKNKGESIGLNIKLGHATRANPSVRKGIAFHYFFIRDIMSSYSSRAYIYFPGGLGTLHHVTAMLTEIETKKISKVPIILIGREYWSSLNNWINETVSQKFQTINEEDMQLYTIVDTAEEAFAIAQQAPIRDEKGL